MGTTGAGSALLRVRYEPEARSLEHLRADAGVWGLVESVRASARGVRARHDLLAGAVRVDPEILPGLAQTVRDVAGRAGIGQALEFYVHAAPAINAAVMESGGRVLVLLSSGAVERLSADEMEFVVGHELGHALYGHLEVPAVLVLDGERRVDPRHAMRLMAWQRRAEISADRAGLLCCGSLGVAATALFKTLSGLAMPSLRIDPRAFAQQWNELSREVTRGDGSRQWTATHPFLPLRMRALVEFWESEAAAGLMEGAGRGDGRAVGLREADARVEDMLGLMDPLARDSGDRPDPMLAEFVLWGGLYVASADGAAHERELDDLRAVVGREALERALREHGAGDGSRADPERFRAAFEGARAARRAPLSALDLHRIFTALAAVAGADHALDERENDALRRLAASCGVSDAFVDAALRRAA